MKEQQLQKALDELVDGFGYTNVKKALAEMRITKRRVASNVKKSRVIAVTATPKKPKRSAVDIVKSLDVSDSDRYEILFELAKKYEAKEFMPTAKHVRVFLHDSGRDVSRIKSRQQVTSAVFKKLASLEKDSLRKMLDRGLYGPPKRLEPYARAIEGFRRSDRVAERIDDRPQSGKMEST